MPDNLGHRIIPSGLAHRTMPDGLAHGIDGRIDGLGHRIDGLFSPLTWRRQFSPRTAAASSGNRQGTHHSTGGPRPDLRPDHSSSRAAPAFRHVSDPLADRRSVPDKKQPDRIGPASPTALLKIVIAQASFIAALMFYLGAVYASHYYSYFHLSLFSLGFGFPELVFQSLNLLKRDVIVAVVIIVIAASIPRLPARLSSPAFKAVARFHPVVVAAGLVMLVMWPLIQPYGWAAPLTIAAGLLLGQSRDPNGNRPEGLRRRAVPMFAAGVFLFWAATLATWQLAERDAKGRAGDVTHWTGVLVLSTKPLSLSPIRQEDLGAGLYQRYRYTGLRLLVQGNDRYYVVPLGWNVKRDPVYVIRESDNTWIALTPGTQPR
ncbi:hypothetical protein [Streptomyces tubercidicus]